MYRYRISITTLLITLFIGLHGCSGVKLSGAAKPYMPPPPLETKHKNFALVLGGGGIKGIAHVGILEELEKAGIIPDVIIGSSAGAIVGGLYASNMGINELKSLVLNSKQYDILEAGPISWTSGSYNENKLRQYLTKYIKKNNFADLKIPLIVGATNLEFGNLTVFGRGPVIEAIMASAALPGTFDPVKIHGQYFVDCAVMNPIPVNIARNLGYKIIVAVNIVETVPHTPTNNLSGIIQRSTEIGYINLCKCVSENANLIISFNFNYKGPMDNRYNNYLYQEGRKAARTSIPMIIKMLKNDKANI